MAFLVVNSVKGAKDEIPVVIMDVQRLGLDAIGRHPGFRQMRLVVSEDGTEAMLFIEWESRDHFVAYRQSETGRRMVEGATRLHPQISFYEVISSLDA